MSARPVAAASRRGGRPKQELALGASPEGPSSSRCSVVSRNDEVSPACGDPSLWQAVLEEPVLGVCIWWLRRGDTRLADTNGGVCSTAGNATEAALELLAAPCPVGQFVEPPGVLCLPLAPPPASLPPGPAEEGVWKATPPSISEVAARFLRVRRGLPAHAAASGAEQHACGDALSAAAAVPLPGAGARGLAALRITLIILRARCALNVPLKEDGSDSGACLLGKDVQLSTTSASLESPESDGLPWRKAAPSGLVTWQPPLLASCTFTAAPAVPLVLRVAAAARAAHSASSYVAELRSSAATSSPISAGSGARKPASEAVFAWLLLLSVCWAPSALC